jgi:hypothetical protein
MVSDSTSQSTSNMPHAAPATPEEAVLAALCALDAMQHARAVSLADSDSLGDLFRGHCEAVRPRTLEWFAEHHPHVSPGELPAEFERFRRVAADPMRGVTEMFPGVRTHAEFEALDPRDYLLRYLERFDTRVDLVRRLRARGRPVPPELLSAPPYKAYLALGNVPESPDLAHVLYRVVVRRDDAPELRGEVEVVSTRRQLDGTWRLLVPSVHFLRPRGAVVEYIPEQYSDLYEEEMIAARDQALARRAGKQ